jgi:glycosyltransferase involved in cell wall biosynthesis
VSRPDVALVTPYPPPGSRHEGRTGVASYAGNLVESLTAAGARVAVVAPAAPGVPARSHDGPVPVERPFRLGSPRAVPDALSAARATGAPVVHLQHELFLYGGPATVPGLLWGLNRLRAARTRTAVTLHHVLDPAMVDRDFVRLHRVSAPPAVARSGVAAIQTALSRLADAVIVHERPFAQRVPGAVVVPHGVEAVKPVCRAEARAALGLDERPVVLCFGFLAPYKGLEVALQAAERTQGAVSLVVAGGEHPRLAASGDDYAATLRARYGSVARFTGRVPEAEVSRWFSAADLALFLYPQAFSSSGALALALAHGTPFLLSPALADAVGAPALAIARDPAVLAEHLLWLAGAPDRLAALQRSVRGLAAERAWPVVAQRHLQLYEGLTRADRPARGRLRAA